MCCDAFERSEGLKGQAKRGAVQCSVVKIEVCMRSRQSLRSNWLAVVAAGKRETVSCQAGAG